MFSVCPSVCLFVGPVLRSFYHNNSITTEANSSILIPVIDLM